MIIIRHHFWIRRTITTLTIPSSIEFMLVLLRSLDWNRRALLEEDLKRRHRRLFATRLYDIIRILLLILGID